MMMIIIISDSAGRKWIWFVDFSSAICNPEYTLTDSRITAQIKTNYVYDFVISDK